MVSSAKWTPPALIDLGEEQARLCLLEHDRNTSYLKPRYSYIAWMTRLLYESKGETPLRGPDLGTLDLPHHSMPLQKWPYSPLAVSDGCIFVLANSYSLRGLPESHRAYLDYCRQKGVFRKRKFRVPTKSEASQSLDKLFASQRWQQIKWRHNSYEYKEEHRKAFLRRQLR